MAEQKDENVLFKVTRPRTSVFHPDRAKRYNPAYTGDTLELPKSVADYHVSQGVGEIVTEAGSAEEPQDASSEAPKAPARGTRTAAK